MTPDQAQSIEQFRRSYRPVPDWCLEAIAECPRAFGYTPPSRAELRALPLVWILYGTPLLIHPQNAPDAPLTTRLQEYRVQLKRAHDPDAKRRLAIQARRTWVHLVECAVGIRVEVFPGVMGESVLRDD